MIRIIPYGSVIFCLGAAVLSLVHKALHMVNIENISHMLSTVERLSLVVDMSGGQFSSEVALSSLVRANSPPRPPT